MFRHFSKGIAAVFAFAFLLSVVSCGSSGKDVTIQPMTAGSLDSLTPLAAPDYSRANRIPRAYTGYWTKSLTVGSTTRTVKVYIPTECPIRAYYTFIAVPDGVDTSVFIQQAGWKSMADSKNEGLVILEPGTGGWGTYDVEVAYVNAVFSYINTPTQNHFFTIFGEHYFVGYGAGAPALEAWAVANPLRVISQVYIDSTGVPQSYIDTYKSVAFTGANGSYTTIPSLPTVLTYNQAVLPTWYINPATAASDSIAYWKAANDCAATGTTDSNYGTVYSQSSASQSWMTSYSGPISKVAVLSSPVDYYAASTTTNAQSFMYYYTRYENMVAYSNQLSVRANYRDLGVVTKNITVGGEIREYMVYEPASAADIWGDKIPVVFIFPGDSQTDLVYFDATQWWQVAKKEGFLIVMICEQYNANANNGAVAVSHKNNNLFLQALIPEIKANYKVDTTRFYCTGQSAGSMTTQSFAIAHPEYFAAVATTSGTSAPDGSGNVNLDGISGGAAPAVYKPIPDYMIVGAGDIANFAGTLWDTTTNGLDNWASYHLPNWGLTLGTGSNSAVSGWQNRFTDWTWTKTIGGSSIPVFKVGLDAYRSHNCISEEMPKLWDFLQHYSCVTDGSGNVTRYYSASGFTAGDKIQIN